MKWTAVDNYAVMSEYGAELIFQEVAAACREKRPFNLGLATGNTMLELYRLLAEKLNAAQCDLSLLQTWNLDEYADDGVAVPETHPLSYRRYMKENFFNRLDPERGFTEKQYHFPDPEDPEGFDKARADAGNLDLQLLGIGFNGHIAFNEPMSPDEISKEDFAALPTRLIALKEMTIATNKRLTAGGADIVPRQAATMGMKQILEAKKMLLLACFPEQAVPLKAIRDDKLGPDLPASYLAEAADSEIVWTKDVIDL